MKKVPPISVKISERGQLVVPKKLRTSLDIKPNMILGAVEENGRLVLTPQRDLSYLDRAFEKWRGTGLQSLLDDGYKDVDDYIETIRGR
jgi:AbrB family looped-hinge helix DNA binding protein